MTDCPITPIAPHHAGLVIEQDISVTHIINLPLYDTTRFDTMLLFRPM